MLTGTPSFAQPAGVALPEIPAPVPVAIDAKSAVLLVMDFNAAVCKPNPACIATMPGVVAFAKRARDAKVPVLHTTAITPAGPSPALDEVAPQSGEPVIAARADKFIDSNLEELLKQRNATTLILVGTVANGAIMYTAFHANVRGFTVVVAEDGISSATPFNNLFARHQLLQQPGFANTANKPLEDKRVTLSKMDLITFK
ncbi:MAG: isochorismatase family protein [Xanthobacteraceae bacterium]